MRFTSKVPSYVINLRRAESLRWGEVMARAGGLARRLADEAAPEFARVPEVARWLFSRLYATCGGRYTGEIGAWGNTLGVSTGTATLLNCSYELSQVSLTLTARKIFGCTAGVTWVEGLGLVHLRNLDWPLTHLGNATCLFRFRRGRREFISVGIAGFVGVLSGMLPGRYSATINWAPPVTQPTFDFGPAFLLRETLEECDSYQTAVETLTHTPLSSSVFFTVCGTQPGQACVIERTQSEAVVRPIEGSTLVQANHHLAECFAANNQDLLVTEAEGVSSYIDSQQRAGALENALRQVSTSASLDEAAFALNVAPTLNEMTYQQMAFCPSTGEVRVWRRQE